jgi:uncharacterized cupin superfamily protein
MDYAQLVRGTLQRLYSDTNERTRAACAVIRKVARVSTPAAASLLDALPEADVEGMQVYTPSAEGLRAQGSPDGAGSPERPMTFTRRRCGSIDGVLATGEWESEAGRHEIKFDFDEWLHVIEGEALVTVQGRTRLIQAGDVALFRAGLSMTWDVPRYIRKVWVHRYPQPTLLARAFGFIKRRLGSEDVGASQSGLGAASLAGL